MRTNLSPLQLADPHILSVEKNLHGDVPDICNPAR